MSNTGIPLEWSGLIGVCVGAALNIFGTWIAARKQIEQARLQLDHEQDAIRESLHHKHVEELYLLVYCWLTAEELLKPDMPRMVMLFDLYCRSSKKEYSLIIEAWNLLDDIDSEAVLCQCQIDDYQSQLPKLFNSDVEPISPAKGRAIRSKISEINLQLQNAYSQYAEQKNILKQQGYSLLEAIAREVVEGDSFG